MRNLFSWIKDFARGFYWQVIQEDSLRILGNIRDYFIGILFELYAIKSFSECFFCFRDSLFFNLCNLEPIATA